MINAVVFDLDGLIFNTEEVFIRATSEFLQPLGFNYDDQVRRRMMGQQAHVSIQILKDHYGLTHSVTEIRSAIESNFIAVLPEILAVMPGFEELRIHLINNHIPMAVCTSSTSEYAKKLLEEFGYLEEFQFVLGAEEVENGKPAPDCYQLACRRLDLLPEQVMVLEDSENGCRAAVDAGTFAVAVPGSHNQGHNYSGASLVAKTLSDPRIRMALQSFK
ncbi:MAG: HAD family phosphatase [Pirellulales bacterium]|nr:HAD family phosphatase [Pirellulales bacterium]